MSDIDQTAERAKRAYTRRNVTEDVTAGPERAPARTEARTDSVEAARLRALEIEDHGGALFDSNDKYAVPADLIPDGWIYGWKEYSVTGKIEPSRQSAIKRAGWTPVPSNRHPEMMPDGDTSGVILRDGLMLYELPKQIADRYRAAERQAALNQMRSKEAQLGQTPPNTLARDADPRTRPLVRRTYEPGELPNVPQE